MQQLSDREVIDPEQLRERHDRLKRLCEWIESVIPCPAEREIALAVAEGRFSFQDLGDIWQIDRSSAFRRWKTLLKRWRNSTRKPSLD